MSFSNHSDREDNDSDKGSSFQSESDSSNDEDQKVMVTESACLKDDFNAHLEGIYQRGTDNNQKVEQESNTIQDTMSRTNDTDQLADTKKLNLTKQFVSEGIQRTGDEVAADLQAVNQRSTSQLADSGQKVVGNQYVDRGSQGTTNVESKETSQDNTNLTTSQPSSTMRPALLTEEESAHLAAAVSHVAGSGLSKYGHAPQQNIVINNSQLYLTKKTELSAPKARNVSLGGTQSIMCTRHDVKEMMKLNNRQSNNGNMKKSETCGIQKAEELNDIFEEEWDYTDFRKNMERKRLIRRILKLCDMDDGTRKPLNIVIIGPSGCGRSAFINTLAAALSADRWREHAYYGSHGDGLGNAFTMFFTAYEKCGNSEKYQDFLLPTLIDIPGFGDWQGEVFRELLRIILYGRLPEGERLVTAWQYYKDHDLEGLKTKYSRNNEKLKVDRVIFLTSATQRVPQNLISVVLEAARPSGFFGKKKRTIPLFGVMTKFDKVVRQEEYERLKSNFDWVNEKDYEKREKEFIHALGLEGSKHRFLRCSNYCDDVDEGKVRVDSVILDLDLPVLRFFTQVVDPVLMVLQNDEIYIDEEEMNEVPHAKLVESAKQRDLLSQANTSHKERLLALALFAWILSIAFVLSDFYRHHVDTEQIDNLCKELEMQNEGHVTELYRDSLTEICRAMKPSMANVIVSSIKTLAVLICLVAIGAKTVAQING